MALPTLTLTTDFGLSDHFVGTMKGVLLSICPEARIVDISHDIRPFAIAEGAYVIAQAYRFFPPGTVHVVVVDPGVGTERRPILVEAGGQYFVAPDNGALGMIYTSEEHRVRVISNEGYFLKQVSRTFHGRDIFAPVAAHLAAGEQPSSIGPLVEDYLRPAFEKPVAIGEKAWRGAVLKVDRFGNIITNFHERDFPDLGLGKFAFRLGSHAVNAMANYYEGHGPEELFAIAGSSGFVEISVGRGSAAALTGCGSGDEVELRFFE